MRKYRGYDVVVDDGFTITEVMDQLLDGLEAEYVVVNEHGPGGGNAEMLVIGEVEALEVFERRYNDGELVYDRAGTLL